MSPEIFETERESSSYSKADDDDMFKLHTKAKRKMKPFLIEHMVIPLLRVLLARLPLQSPQA